MKEKISTPRKDHPGVCLRAILAGAVFVVTLLPLTGRAQELTSFSDTSGQHVFFVDNDQNVRQLFWNVSTWANQDLTSIGGATNVAAGGGEVTSFSDMNGEHALYIGPNSHVYQMYLPLGGNWTNQDLTIASDAPNLATAGQLTSFSDINGEHVFYTATNSQICQLFMPWGGAWVYQDLTASAGGVTVNGSLAGLSDVTGEHVFYQGTDLHTHQLYSPWKGNWTDQDLTKQTGGPLTTAGMTAFADAWGEHALYLACSGGACHVDQLYAAWGSQWVNQDLTIWAKANLASPSTPLTSFANVWGEHVFFIDVNGHVNQLYSYPSWGDQDLSVESRSPTNASVCGPLLTSFSDGAGQHVFYVGISDGDVHELYWNTTGWLDQNPTNNEPYSELPINLCFQ